MRTRIAIPVILATLAAGGGTAAAVALTDVGRAAAPVAQIELEPADPSLISPDDLLLEGPQAGLPQFEPFPDHVDALTLDEVVLLDPAQADHRRALLERARFLHAGMRTWGNDRQVLSITYYQFLDEAGPKLVVDDVLGAVATDPTVDALATGVPGAVGYEYLVPNDVYAYEVHFPRGSRLYHLVLVNLDARPGGVEEIRRVAVEQYRRG